MLGLQREESLGWWAVKLFSQEFQPVWPWYLNVTDRRTTCHGNTELCVASPPSRSKNLISVQLEDDENFTLNVNGGAVAVYYKWQLTRVSWWNYWHMRMTAVTWQGRPTGGLLMSLITLRQINNRITRCVICAQQTAAAASTSAAQLHPALDHNALHWLLAVKYQHLRYLSTFVS